MANAEARMTLQDAGDIGSWQEELDARRGQLVRIVAIMSGDSPDDDPRSWDELRAKCDASRRKVHDALLLKHNGDEDAALADDSCDALLAEAAHLARPKPAPAGRKFPGVDRRNLKGDED